MPARRSVLVVNAGSTSLKLHLVDESEVAEPVEKLEEVSPRSLEGIGHRIVHGGERFRDPLEIDDDCLREVEKLTPLAPLQHPAALAAIERARAVFPDVPHVGVFDTAFHATIPPEAATYAVPVQWRKWGIRRYGFHGLAVASIAEQVRVPRLVACHLGGGCSITAVRDGRSVDTTMGFSPLEGVPMATRSGSVDPGALVYLQRERGLSVEEVDRALQHESGLAALGGLDSELGFAVYTYRVALAVAAMAAALGGIDVLAFSGGVGENRPDVRDAVAGRVGFLGSFDVRVVPAREEVIVARAVRALGQAALAR